MRLLVVEVLFELVQHVVADLVFTPQAERKLLQSAIAARQPFLDMVFTRTNADGSLHRYQVSGEPMFNQASRFIGYRGIGVELVKKH